MKATTVLATALAMAVTCSICHAGTPVLSGLIKSNGAGGISISMPDIVISRGGRVCFTTPNWSEVFLRSVPTPTRPPIKVEKLENGYNESIAAVPASGMVSLKEYSVRCEGNKATVLLQGTAPQGGKTIVMEHVAFVIPAAILEGAEYEITDDAGKTRRGIIPRIQKDKTKRGLLPSFRRGIFRGELGTIAVEVTKGPQVILDDRRSAIFEGHGPAFIIWTGSIPVSETGYACHELKLTYDYPVSKSSTQVSVSSPVFSGISREEEAKADFPMLPVPSAMTSLNETFTPAGRTRLLLINGTEQLLRHAEKLASGWGIAAQIARENTSGAGNILVHIGNDQKDESYTLSCRQDGIVIRAAGERAAFYALQTLRSLYRNGVFEGAEIQDRPAFGIRAVHAMADSDTREHLGTLIPQVLAPLKINTLILECPYVKWDATKGMHHTYGMEKSDLIELLKVARENYISVYPLLPTYSHSEWFFMNGHNMEMIDNPRDKTAYNSLHPGVRPFLTRLFEEVLETFDNPEYFHISHDEVSREHPQRPEGKKLGLRTLFKNDVMWHYNFFRQRNIKLMMWHDMLVSKKETNGRPVANARDNSETLRKELPRDIRICVWNYDGPQKGTYPEVDAVAKDGLPILGAGWYSEGNLETLTDTCLRNKAEGMIITTWHWKVHSGGLLYTQYGQLHSYVRAAALFWHPGTIITNAADILVDLLRKPETSRGILQPISLTGNTLISKELNEFSSLKGETLSTREKIIFPLMRDQNQELAGVCVNSRRFPALPAKIRIPLKQKFDRLHLLHFAFNRGTRSDKTAVKLVFRYTDNTYEAVYLRNGTDVAYGAVPIFRNDNGKETYRPDEVATLFDLPSFQRNQYNKITWTPSDGTPRALWSYTWNNPHPEKELDHLLLEAKDPNTTYCLMGLTGENLNP